MANPVLALAIMFIFTLNCGGPMFDIIADVITVFTFIKDICKDYPIICFIIGFILVIWILWRNRYKICGLLTCERKRYIESAFNTCGKNLPTLCGEPYRIISDLKYLKEHIWDNLNDLNKALRESDWFAMWSRHEQCVLVDNIMKWCSAFHEDTKMYKRLDNLCASVKVVKIKTISLRSDYKRDEISELSDAQRNAIVEAIDDVLCLAYQYKAEYHIE